MSSNSGPISRQAGMALGSNSGQDRMSEQFVVVDLLEKGKDRLGKDPLLYWNKFPRIGHPAHISRIEK